MVCEADADRAFYEEINRRLTASGLGHVKDALFLNAVNKQTIRRIVKPLRQMGVPAVAVVDLDILKKDGFNTLLEDCFVPDITRIGWATIRAQLEQTYKNLNMDMKQVGLSVLDTGIHESADGLIRNLREYGIFVVHFGELEKWLSRLEVKGKKVDWLINMFEKLGSDPASADYVRPGIGDVWKFVSSMQSWIDCPNRKGMPSS